MILRCRTLIHMFSGKKCKVEQPLRLFPPENSKSGFYTRYFLVPKKDGRLRPVLDLRYLNRALMKRLFRMLTLKKLFIWPRCRSGLRQNDHCTIPCLVPGTSAPQGVLPLHQNVLHLYQIVVPLGLTSRKTPLRGHHVLIRLDNSSLYK